MTTETKSWSALDGKCHAGCPAEFGLRRLMGCSHTIYGNPCLPAAILDGSPLAARVEALEEHVGRAQAAIDRTAQRVEALEARLNSEIVAVRDSLARLAELTLPRDHGPAIRCENCNVRWLGECVGTNPEGCQRFSPFGPAIAPPSPPAPAGVMTEGQVRHIQQHHGKIVLRCIDGNNASSPFLSDLCASHEALRAQLAEARASRSDIVRNFNDEVERRLRVERELSEARHALAAEREGRKG